MSGFCSAGYISWTEYWQIIPRPTQVVRVRVSKVRRGHHNTISCCHNTVIITSPALQHLGQVIESSGYQENCTKCVMIWSLLLFQSTDVSPEQLTSVIRSEQRNEETSHLSGEWLTAGQEWALVMCGLARCVMCTGVWLFYVNCPPVIPVIVPVWGLGYPESGIVTSGTWVTVVCCVMNSG